MGKHDISNNNLSRYYVHFSGFNKRLDDWVDHDRLDLETLKQPPSKEDKEDKKKKDKKTSQNNKKRPKKERKLLTTTSSNKSLSQLDKLSDKIQTNEKIDDKNNNEKLTVEKSPDKKLEKLVAEKNLDKNNIKVGDK